ncbi:hypothetical protein [Aeromonas dhakensis]|uniref:hypothetical protein n=1 Tax=Aeromonas dhakensis TaxID=196024 RepID=UPI002446BA1F|nr:hypothetical protein [Aeromonas dhakensis]MDH0348132.1 hypothetical protein [Aeromonas dhakensis]
MVVKVSKLGRPRNRNRKQEADYQRDRRNRERLLGILELRGVRISDTERDMLDRLVDLEQYSSRGELLMTLARREADRLGVDYCVKRDDRSEESN